MDDKTWNYRIVRHVEAENREWYAFHEAYYNGGDLWTISEEPICPSAETVAELAVDLELLHEAFDKPILDYDRLQGEQGQKS